MHRTMAVVAIFLGAALGIGRPARGGEPAEAPPNPEPAASIASPEQFVDRIRELIDANISAAAVRLVTLTPEQRARVSALLERAIADINRRRLIAAGQPDLAAQLPPDAPGDVIAEFADRINADPRNALSSITAASEALNQVNWSYVQKFHYRPGGERPDRIYGPDFADLAWADHSPDAEYFALIREYVRRVNEGQVFALLDRAAAAPYAVSLVTRVDGRWDVGGVRGPTGLAGIRCLSRALHCAMLLSLADGDLASLPAWAARSETLAALTASRAGYLAAICSASVRTKFVDALATALACDYLPRETVAELLRTLERPAPPPLADQLRELAMAEAPLSCAVMLEHRLYVADRPVLARSFLGLPPHPEDRIGRLLESLSGFADPNNTAPPRPEWAARVDAMYRELPEWPELTPVRAQFVRYDWWELGTKMVSSVNKPHRDGLRLLLALELYRLDHADTYSGALTDLVPKYLPAIPVNPLSPDFAADPATGWHYIRHEPPDKSGRRFELWFNQPPSAGRTRMLPYPVSQHLGPPGPTPEPFGSPRAMP